MKDHTKLIEKFQKIELPDPVDSVIQQIRELIHNGDLKPGDRLPSERRLEERMAIPRGYISKALKRMETYGILKTVPQSGTYVAAIGIDALEGLLTNVLKLDNEEFEALDSVRCVLEVYAAELVATESSDEEISELENVHKSIRKQIEHGTVSFDEDMVFHLKLAEFSKNPILKSLITLLTSDFIQLAKNYEEKMGKEKLFDRLVSAGDEHGKVIEAIKRRDPEGASAAIREHFSKSKDFRTKIFNENETGSEH